MDISKLLLIDIALAISAIPLLFWLKGRHNKSSLFQSSNKEELLKKTCIALPDKENLIDLEKLAMREGSSIDFDSLVGDWKFISVWNKDSNDEDSIFSSLLRVFSANLELKKDISPQKPLVFAAVFFRGKPRQGFEICIFSGVIVSGKSITRPQKRLIFAAVF